MIQLALLSSVAFGQDASVRALHISAETADLDVFVNGMLHAADVAYLEASVYAPASPGVALVQAALAGDGVGGSIVSSSATLVSGASYTSITYGPDGALQGLTLLDDNAGIASGESRLQLIHGAAGFSSMDLYVPQGKVTLTDDIPYGAFDTIDVPAGTFDLFIDLDNDSSADWTFVLPSLLDGEVVTLAIVADAGNLKAVVLTESGSVLTVDGVFIPKPSVRFAQLSPDLPTADLFLGFDFVADVFDLDFGSAPPTVLVRPGSTAFTLSEAGSPPTSPYGAGSSKLESDVDYIAFSYGPASNLRMKAFRILDMVDYPGQTGLRIVHTAVDLAASIDVYDDGVLLYDDQGYGRPNGNARTPGAFTLGIDEDNDTILEHTFSVPDFGADAFVNLFITTDIAGTPLLIAVKPNDEVEQIAAD